MSRIVSVIPNVCEGQDKQFIDGLTARLRTIPGLVILDVSMDATRNRTVFALTGSQEAIYEGGMVLYEESSRRIDMRRHKGEYPRIGAVDVFPFVPLKDVTIEETIKMSEDFAHKVAEKFNIPVYLYGESARFPMRRDVEKIREVQYEGLEERLKDPRWKPDFGPDEFNAEFGATIIGSRYPLVSFKIHLSTPNIDIARKMSEAIQYCGGGLRHVTANPGVIYENKLTQITVSIHNYEITPMYKVIEMIRMEGRRFNVNIDNVEMIGLIPERAFFDSALYYMSINQFSYERLLERNILQHLKEELQ